MAQPISLHPFAKAGKYGFIDDDGMVRIPARFAGALDSTEGLAPAAVIVGDDVFEGGKYGKNCRVKTVRWGFVDAAGRAVTSFRYSQAKAFSEGLAAVSSGRMWGFVDAKGQWIIPPGFDTAGGFRDGVAAVTLAGWNALIDRTGRVLVKREVLKFLGEGLAAYARHSQGFAAIAGEPLGLMDLAGNSIQPPGFEAISPFSESLAAVRKDGRWGFIDRQGRVVIPVSFPDPPDAFIVSGYDPEYVFRDGLSKVYTGEHFGYIDHTGKLAIAARFTAAGPFHGGLASACISTEPGPASPAGVPNSRCGFIDKTGSFIFTPRFGAIESFDGAWALVRDPVFGEEMRVNRRGKVLDRPRKKDEPHLEPYGECGLLDALHTFGGGGVPSSYLVTVSFKSTPSGASVHLVPLWDWETHQNGSGLLADPDAMAAYLVTQGATPLDAISLKAQVYMAVFELPGRPPKIAKLVAAENGTRQVSVSF